MITPKADDIGKCHKIVMHTSHVGYYIRQSNTWGDFVSEGTVKQWVRRHPKTVCGTLGAGILLAVGADKSMTAQNISDFLEAVDSGKLEFTVRDERGKALDMSRSETLQSQLNALALNYGRVTISIGWPGKEPVCKGQILAIEAKDIFEGKPISLQKPDGLKLDLRQLNDFCEQYRFGKKQAALEPVGPYSTVAANGAVMEQLVAEPKRTRT